MCVDHTMGITTIPKNGMLGVTEVSYHFWYDIHTSFFTVYGRGNFLLNLLIDNCYWKIETQYILSLLSVS